MALGALLIAAALALAVYNLYDERRAGEAADLVLEEMAEQTPDEEDVPDYTLVPGMDMPTTTIDGEEYIGTLSIPSLDIEVPVMSEWSVSRLKIAPCRYSGSAYTDDMIIAGHNYRTHFGRLNIIELNTEIVFTDVLGNEFVYTVTKTERLSPSEVERMQSGEDWDLTLFTCTFGGQKRYTVRCTRVKDSAEAE
jgi:sortase A